MTAGTIAESVTELLEAAKDALATLQRASPYAFTNGVEHNGIDEGDVIAGQTIDRLRAAIRRCQDIAGATS